MFIPWILAWLFLFTLNHTAWFECSIVCYSLCFCWLIFMYVEYSWISCDMYVVPHHLCCSLVCLWLFVLNGTGVLLFGKSSVRMSLLPLRMLIRPIRTRQPHVAAPYWISTIAIYWPQGQNLLTRMETSFHIFPGILPHQYLKMLKISWKQEGIWNSL